MVKVNNAKNEDIFKVASMRYIDFKDAIRDELRKNPDGFAWIELRKRLYLPYERPCPTWVRQLEQEIGLTRTKDTGRAYVWKVKLQKN